MKQSESVKASGLYLIGNMASKAMAFLTIPIFTRLLTTSEYGIVNTYLAWVQIATIVAELSLHNSFRKAYADYRQDFDAYCASTLRLGGLLFLNSLVMATAAILLLPQLRPMAWLIYCGLLHAFGIFCVTSMSTQYMMQFQYRKRSIYMIVPNVACALLSVLVLLMMTSQRYVGRILVYVFVYVLFAVISYVTTAKHKTNRSYWRYALRYSLPLVFHGLSLVVLSSSDRIMITSLYSVAESGIYSLVYNIGMLTTAVMLSLSGLWVPWFTKRLKENQIAEINHKAVYLVENMTVIVAVFMLVSPEIIKLISTSDYWSGTAIITPIILAAYIMSLYSLAVNVEYQYGATRQIALNSCIAAALNLGLNALFIPKYGAAAAAYTTVAAYTLSLLVHTFFAKKLCRGIFPVRKYLLYIAGVVLVSVLCVLGLEYSIVRLTIAAGLASGYFYLMFARKRFIALQIKPAE